MMDASSSSSVADSGPAAQSRAQGLRVWLNDVVSTLYQRFVATDNSSNNKLRRQQLDVVIALAYLAQFAVQRAVRSGMLSAIDLNSPSPPHVSVVGSFRVLVC
jgi:hypothetical protein